MHIKWQFTRLQELPALGNHFEIPSAWPDNRAVRVLNAFVGPSPSTPDWDSSVFPSSSLPHSKPCHFGVNPIRFRNIPVHSPLHRCWGQALDTAYPGRGYRTCCQTRCLGELLHQYLLWFPLLAPKSKPRAGASTSISVVWTSMVTITGVYKTPPREPERGAQPFLSWLLET
jgi:hypothetical protein